MVYVQNYNVSTTSRGCYIRLHVSTSVRAQATGEPEAVLVAERLLQETSIRGWKHTPDKHNRAQMQFRAEYNITTAVANRKSPSMNQEQVSEKGVRRATKLLFPVEDVEIAQRVLVSHGAVPRHLRLRCRRRRRLTRPWAAAVHLSCWRTGIERERSAGRTPLLLPTGEWRMVPL